MSRQESDAVSHPSHYTGGGIEAKDALKSAMAGSGLSPMASYWWGCDAMRLRSAERAE